MNELINLAQLFGFFGFAMGVWKLQLKNHRSIVWWDIPGGLTWGIHFYLIAGYSGLIINGLSILRAIVKCYLPQKYSTWAIYAIVVLIWALCLYFYQDVYSLLPPIASTIATYGMLGSCRRQLTNYILLHYIFWLGYGIAMSSPFMCLSVVIGMGSCLIGKLRHEKRRLTDTNNDLVKQPA